MHTHTRARVTAPVGARRLAGLLAIAAFAIAACTSGGASPSATPPVADKPLEGTPWQLVEYVGAAGGVVTVPATVTVTATFEGGTVSGNGGCNNYSAPYTVDGAKLSIGEVQATMMACTGPAGPVEPPYLAILPKVATFAIAGDTLELLNETGTITLRYRASSGGAGAATQLEGTAWQLTDYVGPDGKTLAVPEAVAATATFADGKVTGNGGCNQYTGSYTLDGDKLAISGVAATSMACPEVQMAVETAYFAALGKVATYAIAGGILELMTAEGTVGLRYRAAETPSLTKTLWVATMINTGTGATASVVAGSTVTAIFAEDGTVAGSGGCNKYNGTYTVDGAALTFGPLLSTKMACANEAVTKQEANYLAALAKVTTHAFSGDNLELRDADGALQVKFEPKLP
jgi:heat shock protein HslJ